MGKDHRKKEFQAEEATNRKIQDGNDIGIISTYADTHIHRKWEGWSNPSTVKSPGEGLAHGILHPEHPVLIIADIGHNGPGGKQHICLGFNLNTFSSKKKKNPVCCLDTSAF